MGCGCIPPPPEFDLPPPPDPTLVWDLIVDSGEPVELFRKVGKFFAKPIKFVF
jgi:hypothetical protein